MSCHFAASSSRFCVLRRVPRCVDIILTCKFGIVLLIKSARRDDSNGCLIVKSLILDPPGSIFGCHFESSAAVGLLALFLVDFIDKSGSNEAHYTPIG